MRLRRVGRDDLKVQRKRRGRGFCYLSRDGSAITDEELKLRIAEMVIPPAWTEVRIAEHPRAHIQCVGLDAAGRLQYIYHPEWQARRTARKQGQLLALIGALPAIRRNLARDLAKPEGSAELPLAIAASLIDKTAMRIGREEYLAENGTRGASTLLTRDVSVDGDTVTLKFIGKGGKAVAYKLVDQKLADAIIRIKTLRGKRLLLYRNGEGLLRPIKATMINGYLRKISGAKISAKDFRTMHASAMAGDTLAHLEPGKTRTQRDRQAAEVTRQVAELLRNTPAISRKSYIAPCIFDLFERGRLQSLWGQQATAGRAMRNRERALADMLAKLA